MLLFKKKKIRWSPGLSFVTVLVWDVFDFIFFLWVVLRNVCFHRIC